MKNPAVYIITNRKGGTLYIGVTSNLRKRVWEHKHGAVQGFSDKYNLHTLVYFEVCVSMKSAIIREKQLKNWKRSWKIVLIEESNKNREDLWDMIVG